MTTRNVLAGIAIPALIATMPIGALADGATALAQAVVTTYKQSSYHEALTTKSGTTLEADGIPPDRMRVMSPTGETIAIGSTTYMQRNGTWMKLPGMDILAAQRDPLKAIAAAKGNYAVDDLGMQPRNGVPFHAYRATNRSTRNVDTIFVDASGRIARIETANAVIEFSRYGAPVSIQAPM